MKLVELLARELKVWPEEATNIAQDADRCAHPYSSVDSFFGKEWGGIVKGSSYNVNMPELATDHATAIVTRAEWEAEVARLAQPQESQWIRHRGGKCPVEVGVKVDYRMRCDTKAGIFSTADDASKLRWSHGTGPGDIMAYRICEPEQAPESSAPEVCAEALNQCVEAFGDSHADVMESVLSRMDGPLAWRDRIHEIDITVEALEEERAGLVQQLEDEGFRLIGKEAVVADHVVDMSDWRNWEVGDLAEVVSTSGFTQHKLSVGDIVPIIDIDEHDGTVKAAVSCWGDVGNNYKWHSRPSA